VNEFKRLRLQWTTEAEELRNSLTLAEKVLIMSGNHTIQEIKNDSIFCNLGIYFLQNVFESGGIPEKKIPSIRFCDGTRGVVGRADCTCFPTTICRGATFNKKLEKAIGSAMGKEVRANNGNLFAGVCINLPYHPGWGRSQETYGEESYHIGEMGSALVEGVQSERVIACIKHFAFNSMEYSRFKVNIVCDIRTEREVFLPHFKKCIDRGAACIMSAYNSYQGTLCGHHHYLLNQVLKSEWDFDGFVISDFICGIKDTVAAANAGMDREMCVAYWFGERLQRAVEDGLVPEDTIDDAVLRIIRTLLAVERDEKAPDDEPGVDLKKHSALALQAAREGITLIKNAQILPLNKKDVRKVVVLGRLAEKKNLGDHGAEWVASQYIITPLQGIANIARDAEVTYYDGRNLQHAKRLAARADAVIFVVGNDEGDEGEYLATSISGNGSGSPHIYPGDRQMNLELHPNEIELVKEVGVVNDNSIVVLMGGGMIMIEEWKDYVNAIMLAYYPGMEGGTAIAEIIFGDINPSGKLPFVIPRSENDLPPINWDTDYQYYEYYHGYTRLEKQGKVPSMPFGFGLSYTAFQLSNERFKVSGDTILALCEIENTGAYDGDEVVQLYIGFSNSKVNRPVKILRGFEKVSVRRNERKQVKITCSVDEIKWYNPKTEQMELEQMEYEIFIGTSSRDQDLLKGKITI